ncbi:MAG: hypothetical protein PGN34_25260 [Methylobacterium frigidaeris]
MRSDDMRWIVQGQAVVDGLVDALVAADRELRDLRQLAPDMVVLSMTEPRAEKLKDELGAAAIIEPDRELPDPRL